MYPQYELLNDSEDAALMALASGAHVVVEADELERLRKDARRYRWLRVASVLQWEEIAYYAAAASGTDATIDAAITNGANHD